MDAYNFFDAGRDLDSAQLRASLRPRLRATPHRLPQRNSTQLRTTRCAAISNQIPARAPQPGTCPSHFPLECSAQP